MSWVGTEARWTEAASEGFQAACEAVRGPGHAITGTQAAVMGEVCGQGSRAQCVRRRKRESGRPGKTTACVRKVSRAHCLHTGLFPSTNPHTNPPPQTHTYTAQSHLIQTTVQFVFSQICKAICKV